MPRKYEQKLPVLSEDEKREILETMPPGNLRMGVENGDYYILAAGEKVGKPVLRHTAGPMKGRPVKGTGVLPGTSKAISAISKDTAYQRTAAWKTVAEEYWGPKLPEVFAAAREMMQGGMVSKAAACPECGHKFAVEMYKKGDAQALKVVWESIIGRASERKEVDVNIRALMARLDVGKDVTSLEIVDLNPEEVAQRMALAAGADILDGEWTEARDED